MPLFHCVYPYFIAAVSKKPTLTDNYIKILQISALQLQSVPFGFVKTHHCSLGPEINHL